MADSQVTITPGSGAAIDTQVPTGGDHRQVVVLGDPTSVAGVATVSGGALSTNINQYTFVNSSLNSSAAQLAAAATFTGAVEATFGYGQAIVSVISDQPVTIAIDNFLDAGGTKLVSTDTYTRLAGVPFNEVLTIPADYWRVRVTNTGASTTTTLSVDTGYGTIQTGPRGPTNLGNVRTGVVENGTTVTTQTVTGNGSYTLNSAGMSNLTLTTGGTFTTFGIAVQGSNDGFVTAATLNMLKPDTGSNATAWTFTASATNGLYVSAVGFNQVRVTISAFTGTSVSLTMGLSAMPSPAIGYVQPVGNTTVIPGAFSTNFLNSAASTNATLILGTATKILSALISNNGASAAYVKLFNKSTAPVPGTDTPTAVIVVPPTSHVSLDYSQGLRFTTGLGFAITGAIADLDTTAVAAGQVKTHIYYG